MKEVLSQKLANPFQTPYSKGGDTFMEGKPDMPPQNSQPTNPEHAEKVPQAPKLGAEKTVSAERQAAARKAWERFNAGRVLLPDEKWTQEELIRIGATSVAGGSQDNIDEATRRWEEAARQGAGAGGTGGRGRDRPPTSAEDQPENNGDRDDARNREETSIYDRAKEIYEDLAKEQLGLTEVGLGITGETLIRQIDHEKTVFATNPPDKVDELRKAIERVRQLERVSVGAEDPDLARENDRVFAAEKNRIIQRLESLSERVRNAILLLGRKETSESNEGVFGDRKLSYEEKERIRSAKTADDIEDLFNRVFDRVDRRPNAEFNSIFGTVGAYEYDEFMRVINSEITRQAKIEDLDRVNELEKIVARLSNERAAREIIHNAYFAVITAQNTEAVSNFMASFLTGYADLAFQKSGVVQAMHFYEQALLIVREKNGGYLPAKEVIGNLKTNEGGEVNIITEDLLREKNESGELAVDREGNPRQLAEWELKRALSFARGMSVVTGRSIEIAATSILPGVESGSSVYIDLFAQKIIAEIYPFRHADKFITRGKVSRALAYLLNRPRKPWTPKELQVFADMELTEQVKVLNDLMPEGKERFYSVLNPFEIGSWLSRSGWRIGGDPRNPGETAIKEMVMSPEEKGWIGTGVIIEKARGDLEKLDSKDEARQREGTIALGKIDDALEQTAFVTPLRFFLNIREFKERVLKDLLKMEGEGEYFNGDERKAINDEIDRIIEKKEKIRIEEDAKDEELLKRKGLKPAEKDEKKEEERKTEQREKITFEEVMKNPRFSQDMEDLVLLQERAVVGKNKTLVLENSPLGRILNDTFLHGEANVKEGVEETYKQMFLRRLKDKSWKTPFIFGTEDVPFNKYVFEATGARSGSRRWADMAAAAKAGQAFGELLNGLEAFTEQGQIVDAMYKIHHSIKDYNEESAQRFIQSLSEGIMKFYAKTWTHRLPLGIGTANSMIGGNSSYAQIAFGRDKMAWDETKLNEFTRLVRNRGMNTVEQQHKLQERAGGDKKGVVWDSARTMLPLIMIALAYYMMSQVVKEKS